MTSQSILSLNDSITPQQPQPQQQLQHHHQKRQQLLQQDQDQDQSTDVGSSQMLISPLLDSADVDAAVDNLFFATEDDGEVSDSSIEHDSLSDSFDTLLAKNKQIPASSPPQSATSPKKPHKKRSRKSSPTRKKSGGENNGKIELSPLSIAAGISFVAGLSFGAGFAIGRRTSNVVRVVS